MRYVPAILLWILADLSLCVVTVVLAAATVATVGMVTGANDAAANGHLIGRASVIGFKILVLHLPY